MPVLKGPKMQCVTPMFRRYEKGNHKKGTVIPRSEVMQELIYEPNYIRKMINIYNKNNRYYQVEQIPCNHCWACNLNYSAEWATRIMKEVEQSEHNYFITLTYDDKHLPILEEIQCHYGETYKMYRNDGTWQGSLFPEDMETFINSLRKYFERKGVKGIKYYYCGEYGETTLRPHYHIILMHCPLNISLFYDTHIDQNFKAHWKSPEVEHYWNKGMVDIAEVEWSCAAYVARYCMKKMDRNPDKSFYYEQGKLPEYTRSSQHIGETWYKEHKNEIYANDEIIMKTVKGNIGSYKPPKAWDKKFKETNPEEFKKIQRSRRTAAERSRKLQEQLNNYTDLKKLEMKADKLQTKMQMLPRVGEW